MMPTMPNHPIELFSTPWRLKTRVRPPGLQQAERDRQPAGPAGDLAAPEFAFLAQLLHPRGDDRHELHDDRGIDVGVHPHRDDGERRQAATREQVEQPEEGVGVEQLVQGGLVSARDGDVGEDAKYEEEAQRKQDLPPELGDSERVTDRL